MSTMLVEIYDALKDAGASEEKARAAAASLTNRDSRLDELERHMEQGFRTQHEQMFLLERRLDGVEGELKSLRADVDTLKTDVATLKSDVATLKSDVATLKSDVVLLKTDVAVIKAELGLMKWMHGLTIGGILALLLRSFLG